ncbi:hypothetical protein PLICRDRAFT_38355 [Plicaturopsis crispa FD-325 SS-3]|nr:hypothetical protein PLICRDRAFT_38355 [Plicaturopsis crispa FD-325 SS-3]
MHRPTTRLQSIPPRALYAIRYAVYDDLSAHIALSQTCQSLHAIYQPHPALQGDPKTSAESIERFWQAACLLAGYGRPKCNRPENEEMKWKATAFRIVAHRRKCKILECVLADTWFVGTRTITLPAASALAEAFWHPATQPRPYVHHHEGAHTRISMHPLHAALHLDPHVGAHADPFRILSTHLPAVKIGNGQYALQEELCAHAPASCVFATYPPVRHITLHIPVDAKSHTNAPKDTDFAHVDVSNIDGCTILDVNRALASFVLAEPRLQPLLAQTALHHYLSLVLRLPGHPRAHVTSEAMEAFIDGLTGGFLHDHEYPYLYAFEEFIGLDA